MTGESGRNHRLLLRRALVGLIISSALIAVLLQFVEVAEVTDLFADINWLFYGIGLLLWMCIYLLRAMRFVTLVPATPYPTMLSITAIHNLFLRLMPFRTGELVYGYLVKRAGTASLGKGLLGLLLLRVLDATIVVLFFTVALLVDGGLWLGSRNTGLALASGAALLGEVPVIMLPQLLRIFSRLVQKLLSTFGLADHKRVQSSVTKLSNTVDDFSRLPLPSVLKLAGISAVQWLLTFGAFFAIMRAFAQPVSISQTVLGATAAVVSGFLPIGGIGSFGTQEAGWALGFVLVGLERSQAVASGFGVSLVTLSYCILLGLVGAVVLRPGTSVENNPDGYR